MTKSKTKTKSRFRRAQLLSFDLLIAVSILTAAVGLAVQHHERLQTGFEDYAETTSNNAEVIAAYLLGEGELSSPVEYCVQYSTEDETISGNCDELECPKNVFVAMRLTECDLEPCLLEVRTCE